MPQRYSGVIDQPALKNTKNTVLAWRLRLSDSSPWPLTMAGTALVLLLAFSVIVTVHTRLATKTLSLAPHSAVVFVIATWLLNGLIAHAGARNNETKDRLLWTQYTRRSHGLFVIGLIATAMSGLPSWAVEDLLAGACVLCVIAAGSTFPLVRRGDGLTERPTIAEEFGSWDKLEKSLRTSPSKLEKEHLFAGVLAGTDQPLLLHDALLNSHISVCGATRSGKSSRILLPLCVQKIRRRDCTILYIDLKGSKMEFAALGLACRRAKVNFRWVTTETPLSSYPCNPIDQPVWQSMSANERAQLLSAGFGLDFGEAESGPAYFGGQCERVLRGALSLHKDVRSLKEINDAICAPGFPESIGMSKRDFDSSGALLAALGRLAALLPLNWVPGVDGDGRIAEGAIRIEQLLTEPGVVYFRFPATVEASTARVVPRLLIRLLVAAARRAGGAKQQVYIVIDEAQETLQRSLSPVLKQARDLRISVWLAFQNLSDLELAAIGMTDVVLGNTSVRIFLSASDLAAREYLPKASGETSRILCGAGTSVTESGVGTSVGHSTSLQQTIMPRIGMEEINLLNATEGLCIVEAAPKSGFTLLNHPAFVMAPYFCSPQEHNRLSEILWPFPNEFTLTNLAYPSNERSSKENESHNEKTQRDGDAIQTIPVQPESNDSLAPSTPAAATEPTEAVITPQEPQSVEDLAAYLRKMAEKSISESTSEERDRKP